MQKKKQETVCSGCIETYDDKFMNFVIKESYGFSYRTVYCDRCVQTMNLVVDQKVKIVKPRAKKVKEEPINKSKSTKTTKKRNPLV